MTIEESKKVAEIAQPGDLFFVHPDASGILHGVNMCWLDKMKHRGVVGKFVDMDHSDNTVIFRLDVGGSRIFAYVPEWIDYIGPEVDIKQIDLSNLF